MAQGGVLTDELFALQLHQEALMDPDDLGTLYEESSSDSYGNVTSSSDINTTAEHNCLTKSIQQNPTKILHDNLQPNDQSGHITTNTPTDTSSPQLDETNPSVLTDEAIARRMQEESYQDADFNTITDEMLALRLQEESVRTLTDVEIAQQLQKEHSAEEDERLAMQLVQEDTSFIRDEMLARRLQEGDGCEQGDGQTGDSDEFLARQLREENTPVMSDELLARHLQDKDNADDNDAYLAQELQGEESPVLSDEMLARQLQENDNALGNDEHIAKELQDMAEGDAEMARRFQEEEYGQAEGGWQTGTDRWQAGTDSWQAGTGEWQAGTDSCEESLNEESFIGPDDVNPDTDDYEELMELQERVGNVSRGLAKADIERFPITVHSDNNLPSSAQGEGNTCSICLTDFHAGDRKRRLTCMHCFHVVCVDKWLKNNPTCPVCRVEMNTE